MYLKLADYSTLFRALGTIEGAAMGIADNRIRSAILGAAEAIEEILYEEYGEEDGENS